MVLIAWLSLLVLQITTVKVFEIAEFGNPECRALGPALGGGPTAMLTTPPPPPHSFDYSETHPLGAVCATKGIIFIEILIWRYGTQNHK